MFKSKPPKILTAIGFINFNNTLASAGMLVTGDNTGNVVFTNLENKSSKKINKVYLPGGSPAVTSITTKLITTDFAKVIIGFANGCLCIFSIRMKAKGRPTNSKFPIVIDLAKKGEKPTPKMTGIAIINKTSIAAVLSNRTIRLIDFIPDFSNFIFPEDPSRKALLEVVTVNEAVCPTIPCMTHIDSTAILPITQSPGITIYYVYVLTTENQLQIFKYDQMFSNGVMGSVASNVAKIATPTFGSTRLVFTTLDNKIFHTSPILNTPIKEFGTMPGRKSITAESVMTLHDDILYYATIAADKTVQFDCMQLPPLPPVLASPPPGGDHNGLEPQPRSPSPPPSHRGDNPFYNTLLGQPSSSSPQPPTSFSSSPVPDPRQSQYGMPPSFQRLSLPPPGGQGPGGLPGGPPPGQGTPPEGQPPSDQTQYVDLEEVDLFGEKG